MKRISVIRNTLADTVTKVETAYESENQRLAQPVPQNQNPPTRQDLAVTVPMTLNTTIANLLTDLTNRINNYNYPQQNQNQNNQTPTATYNELRAHLSTEAKKSRETQWEASKDLNNQIQWQIWRNASAGRVVSELIGSRVDFANSSSTLVNMRDFQNLLIIENRNGEELVLQNATGTELFLLKPDQTGELMLYRFTGIGPHPNIVPNIDNADEKIEVFRMMAA